MISGFVVYRCHGNIDFSKIATLTNFRLNPVSGRKFHVDLTKESLLKSHLQNHRYGPQKTVPKHRKNPSLKFRLCAHLFCFISAMLPAGLVAFVVQNKQIIIHSG